MENEEKKAVQRENLAVGAGWLPWSGYTVTLEGIKEEKVAAVEDSAVDAAVKALSKSEDATIAIPAGLYYRITPAADLGTWGTPATGCSNGSVDAPTYSTPAATVQKGFYKIELSTVPYEE